MSIGSAIRGLLGAKLARHAGLRYRSIFVNLDKVALALSGFIQRDAHLLDIGGGDGQPLNHLLALRPDLTITTFDPAPSVGQWIDPRYSRQVIRLPGTNLADYLASERASPDAILIADVMHHIPEATREGFLNSVKVLLDRAPRLQIIVKDVEPGSWRASLGFWSDRYITGDRNVSPISSEQVAKLFERILGPLQRDDTNLLRMDRPNYAMVFHR